MTTPSAMQAGFLANSFVMLAFGAFPCSVSALAGVIMKFAFVFLASLFLSVAGAQTVEARTRTIRHHEAGSPR
jgi:hypothetical protein